MPSAEYLVHTLLWLWVAITYPIALTVVVTQLLPAPRDRPAAMPHKRLLAADAFTNPAYVHFALKVTLAAMTCYIILPRSIGLAFALPSLPAVLSRWKAPGYAAQGRAAPGRLLRWRAALASFPSCISSRTMESIASLVLLIGGVSALAGWVAGGERTHRLRRPADCAGLLHVRPAGFWAGYGLQ